MRDIEKIIRQGRDVIRREAAALEDVAARLDGAFADAVERLLVLRGAVIVTGMGKAGLIGQKLAATFASTGTPSHFLHPAEAIHGDLGRISKRDILLALSQSGETEEIVRLLPTFKQMGVPLIAITSTVWSTLGRAADAVLSLGTIKEADAHNLAPSASTTAMLAIGDALALTVSRCRGFRSEDFAVFHPGGALGRKLSRIEETMRPISACRMAPDSETVRDIFIRHSVPGRRSGAILLHDAEGKLSGIFTDSDLARLFEKRVEHQLDRPISEIMTRMPCTIPVTARTLEAVALMAERKISELPVVDEQGFPQGMIDITDIVAFLPAVSKDTTCNRGDAEEYHVRNTG